jgi:NDP-sugar pyrophosphorylase family protein
LIGQAVMLAGGRGTRLGELARHIPKPVLEVGGQPFLGHVLWNLARHGVTDVVLAVGHLQQQVKTHIGDGSQFGVTVRYVTETQALGTAGGLRNCADWLDERFFLINGDSLFDINYLDLALTLELDDKALCALALRSVADAYRYGTVELHGPRITRFSEKGRQGSGLISGGVYACRRTLLEWIPPGFASLELEVFPRLVGRGWISGKVYQGFFIDIGIPEHLRLARATIPLWRRKPALFVERDCLDDQGERSLADVPREWGAVSCPSDALKRANDSGWLVLVIGPDAVVQPGLQEGGASSQAMRCMLARDGTHVEAYYLWPQPIVDCAPTQDRDNLPNDSPLTALLNATTDWNVDLPRSLLIAQDGTIAAAARKAGIVSVIGCAKAHAPHPAAGAHAR